MKRKGSIYILTLTTALVLVIITVGLSRFLIRARQDARTHRQIEQAQIQAQLGLRHALWATHRTNNWREILPNGEWLSDIAIGQAAYTVTGTDPDDNDLADDPADPIILECTAAIGDVSRTLRVQAKSKYMDFLNYRTVAGGRLRLENTADIDGDVYANGNIEIDGSDSYIIGDAFAVGTISNQSHVLGADIENAEPIELPTTAQINNYFSSIATTIPYQNEIFAKLISPTNNPYGTTNPDGVYLMNCSGNKIVIKQSRIIGTLILMNPSDDSGVEISVNWRPARIDYPALIIINGNFDIKIEKDIYEAHINTDLSLPGEPGYGTRLGSYDGEIHGLVFSNRNLTLSQSTKLYGQAVALNNLLLRENVDIETDPLAPNPAIIPFVETALLPVRGTYQWITP